MGIPLIKMTLLFIKDIEKPRSPFIKQENKI